MAHVLTVRIRNQHQDLQLVLDRTLELGRLRDEAASRVVVDDPYVSRSHLRLETVAGAVRIAVLGRSMALDDGRVLARGSRVELAPPFGLTIGRTRIELYEQPCSSGPEAAEAPLLPLGELPAATRTLLDPHEGSPSPHQLAAWFETLLGVQQSAVGSDAFYAETARALVDLVGLDAGMVLLRRNGGWSIVARYDTRPGRAESVFSQRIVARVEHQRQTFYQSFPPDVAGHSLLGVHAVVASPIFDADRQVVGVVYGSRDRLTHGNAGGIHPLEAQIVQVLAATVGTGLARMQRQAEAVRHRVLFEQFASPEVAAELQRDPQLLHGRDRMITLLFCDLRGYSAVAEQLDAGTAYRLLADLLDQLTERVLEQAGVVIDYYGDGLAAMWNAPLDQPDHAERAVRCAQAMAAGMPALNARWAGVVDRPLVLGVGVHSGDARVGNAGSRRRLKYGPRGHAVNVASRIETLTGTLGISPLLTGDTRFQLPPTLPVRRLGRVRLPGVDATADLYDCAPADADPQWAARAQRFEQALRLHELGQSTHAAGLLDALLAERDDAATRLLRERARAGLLADGDDDPWVVEPTP